MRPYPLTIEQRELLKKDLDNVTAMIISNRLLFLNEEAKIEEATKAFKQFAVKRYNEAIDQFFGN